MSRASGASFAQFFPSAPRAAKDKAKEREKIKTHILDPASKTSLADTQSTQSTFRVENVEFPRFGGESNTPIIDPAPLHADDNEFAQGDLLNGVGSASSHSSTVSSVFSAPAQQPNMSSLESIRNVSSMTPLTTAESSPPNRITSPNQYKLDAQAPSVSGFAINKSLPHNDVAQAQSNIADQKTSRTTSLCSRPKQKCQGNKMYIRSPSRSKVELE